MFEKRALMRIFDSFLPAAIAELAQTSCRQGVQPLQGSEADSLELNKNVKKRFEGFLTTGNPGNRVSIALKYSHTQGKTLAAGI